MLATKPFPPLRWDRAKIASLALLAISMLGCASMSEKECRHADWRERGVADGHQGARSDQIADHIQACAKAGIAPDESRWREGWSQGIARFCRPERAWQLGLDGSFYNGACAGQAQGDDFERNYLNGKRLHELSGRIDRVLVDQKRVARELADAKTDEDRKKLRRQLSELDNDLMRLRNQQRMWMLYTPVR